MALRPARWIVALVLLAAGAGGCASTGRLARPSPFPTAVLPPTPLAAPVAPPVGAPAPSNLLRAAVELRGVSYRLGGASPAEGFDCSGFVRYVFGLYHVELPRTVAEQYAVGARVDAARIQPGDLVFFSTIAPGASHVGLALDATTFIHAPGDGGSVRVDRLDAPYWRERLVGVRRPMAQ